MAISVSTANKNLSVESVTRKGRGLDISLSVPRAFFYGGDYAARQRKRNPKRDSAVTEIE